MVFLMKSCMHVFATANDSQLEHASERQIPPHNGSTFHPIRGLHYDGQSRGISDRHQ
jgi:hypothetical protein